MDRFALVFLALSVVLAIPGAVRAADGDLDTSFDGDGRQTISCPRPFDSTSQMGLGLQSDGRIVVGTSVTGCVYLARLNTNGTLDTSFDSDGILYDYVGAELRITDLAVRPDDKIVVAGYYNEGTGNFADYVVVQYMDTGMRDTNFGVNGLVQLDVGTVGQTCRSLLLEPGGKILLAGELAYDYCYLLARYQTNGSVDAIFDNDGIVTHRVGPVGYDDRVLATARQRNGYLLVAGWTKDLYDFTGTTVDYAVLRCRGDGSIDSDFGTNGVRLIDFDGDFDFGQDIVVQTDGRIVMGGQIRLSGNWDWGLIRLTETGAFDPSFGTGGKVTTDFAGGSDGCTQLELQRDGKIIAVGTAGGDFGLARYRTNGVLDTTFGTGGKLSTDFGATDKAYRAELQADDKIIVAGFSGAYDLAVARYLAMPVFPLEPPPPPSDPDSAMYTLEDLYNRLYDGCPGEMREGGFVDPSDPPDGSGHDLNEIMAIAPEKDDTNGLSTAEVPVGKTFWGLTTAEWGPQTGTATPPPAPVPRTGQTTSYGTGSDGDVQKGAAWPVPRFADEGDGTVTDNNTGLVWLKDANRFLTRNWSNAISDCLALADDDSALTDGSEAGDWRLPNVKELMSLVCYEYTGPCIPDGVGTQKWSQADAFTDVQSLEYWSCTTDPTSSAAGLCVHLLNGRVTESAKTALRYVWPVRDKQ